MITSQECLICGGNQFRVIPIESVIKKTAGDISLDPEGKTGWAQCNKCSFMIQNPRLTRDYINEYYANSGYRTKNGKIEIDEGYKAYSPVQLKRFIPWLAACGLNISNLRGANCLDYGCGIGGAMKFLADKGNVVHGVEPDRHLCAYARDVFGINAVETLEQLSTDTMYHLILSHHSLEHVYDPNEFLDFAARRIAQNGAMIVVVPTVRYANTLNALQSFSASHYSMFDHVTLAQIFNKHGFFLTSHLYQNPTPDPMTTDWEICAIAVKSPKKNHFSFNNDEIFSDIFQQIAQRAAEWEKDKRPIQEKISTITQKIIQPQ